MFLEFLKYWGAFTSLFVIMFLYFKFVIWLYRRPRPHDENDADAEGGDKQ